MFLGKFSTYLGTNSQILYLIADYLTLFGLNSISFVQILLHFCIFFIMNRI